MDCDIVIRLGQIAGNIGALTKGGCPYSQAFDYL